MAKQRRRRKTNREPAPEHELPGGFWRQVGAVILLAVAVILVMTWFGSGGTLLKQIHGLSTFVIGYAAYFIPVLLVYLAVMIFRAEGNRLPMAAWVASILMIFWLAGIFGVPTIGKELSTGGVIGESLNKIMIQILDKSVVFFIYITMIFVTGIFILAISPAAVFRAIGNFFRNTRRDEDRENAKIAKRANTEATSAMRDLKINTGTISSIPEVTAKNSRINVAKPTIDKTIPDTERALVAVSDPNWQMPTTELLSKKTAAPDGGNIQQNAYIIKSTFAEFNIDVEVEGANVGPRVTQYTMKPPSGVNLSKITARDKELALNLAVDKIRIEAPIPGTRLVGVEVENIKSADVSLRSILESPEWKKADGSLTFAVGKDISGKVIVGNLAKMPHLLIGGATGMGKSVMTNTLISSLLYRNAPSDMKLIIVDPKQVEMVQYDAIPHLLTPIINSVDKALSAMKWAVNEMERRYTQMAEEKAKTIVDYNKKMLKKTSNVDNDDVQQDNNGHMPYIVIVIDEMADLMMQAGKDFEMLIVRIAQKGRAAGIHLVLATQRPEVKVITGLIKANIPGRISLAVITNTDSRIMLGMGGAEKLLGKGDMLMLTTEMMGKPCRIQGAFVPDADIERLTNFLREQAPPEYNDEVISQAVQIKGIGPTDGGAIGDLGRKYDPNDQYVRKAVEITLSKGKFSTASLQTYLGKGHGFVSGLAIWLEEIGVIGPQNGNKPRDVLIKSMDEFDELAGL